MITALLILAGILWYVSGILSGIYIMKINRTFPNKPLDITYSDLFILLTLCGCGGMIMVFILLVIKYSDKKVFTIK